MAGILIRGGMTHREPQGRRPCEDRGRDWNNVCSNQGLLRIASSHQKLGTDKEETFTRASERAQLC